MLYESSRSFKRYGLYKAIYAREALITRNNREPTVMEIAEETGIPKEDIVFVPWMPFRARCRLYEPVYTDGGDALCIMRSGQRQEKW